MKELTVRQMIPSSISFGSELYFQGYIKKEEAMLL